VIARASEAWSEQRERKDKRELRRLKKQRKRDWLRAQREGGANANGGAGGGGGGGADGDSDGDGDDNAAGDFDDEYAAMQREKKLRKRFREGKMSRKELQEALAENGGSDDSEEALFRATQ
jgi:ATP-dependent RNA helicase DDX55/SPB4